LPVEQGELAEYKGDITTAVKCYRDTIDAFRQTNNLPNLASNLLRLGRVLAPYDSAGAQAAYEESLKFARECGRVDVLSRTLYSLASLEFSQNQRQSAESNARQALDLFRRLGMKREQAEAEALLERLGA
jgi:tetratricopeptide (TPR) repeat protein